MAPSQSRVTWLIGVVAFVVVAVLGWRLLSGADEQASAASDPDEVATGENPLVDRQQPTPSLDLSGAAKASISGTVRDTEGKPIAGAQVCALPNTDDILGFDDHRRACARSEADGHYRIDDLFAVRTGVSASAPTYKPGRWQRRIPSGSFQFEARLAAGQTAEAIDITLEPGGVVVRGVIKDIAGGEIEGAQVLIDGSAWTSHGGTALGFSGDQGQFELWVAPGQVKVRAFANGYAEGDITAVAPGEFVELFLTPESVLVGKVVLASTGEAVAGVTVEVNLRGDARHAAQTDADGRFRINQLLPGTYKPSARADQLVGALAEQVHLGLGETSKEVVIRMHPAARVDGKVVFAGSERPCTDGRVSLNSEAHTDLYEDVDEAGQVHFRGVLAGEYTVGVYCKGAISEETPPTLTVATDNLEGLVWEVREGLAIRGQVVDESGEPVETNALVAVPIAQADGARNQLTRAWGASESDGQFELAGLLPGTYEVHVQGWRARPGPTEPVTVELEPGVDVNDVEIVMPAVGTIRGRIVDESGEAVAGVSLSAALLGGTGDGNSRSNDAGEFVFNDLRPGPTRVTARDGVDWSGAVALRKPGTTDDDVQGEVVEVIANEVAELVLTVESRNGRITGVVLDEGGGPVADAFVDITRVSEKAGTNAATIRLIARWSWGKQPVLTDQDGRFELEGLPEGEFIIHANRKGGGDAIAEDVALDSHVELVIETPGELAGTVKLADGTAPEWFTLAVKDKSSGIRLDDGFFRTDGVWRLTEVPAGTFEISASSAQGTATLEAPVTLAEGEVRDAIELVLTPRLTLRGRIVDLETREGVAGLQVYASSTGGFAISMMDGERRNISDADGRFEVHDAPPGLIHILGLARPGGSKSRYGTLQHVMTLEPEPAIQDIGELEVIASRLEPGQDPGDLGYELNGYDPTLEPKDFAATVASVRPGGPADTAGLVAGDVIEKVGGHSVLGTNGGRYSALTQVPPGSSLKLELRGAKTVEIIVGPPLR